MARIVHFQQDAVETSRQVCLEVLGRDPLLRVPRYVLEGIELDAPFLVSASGTLLEHVNRYLRKRHAGQLTKLSLRRLRPKSTEAYAQDLVALFNTYREPGPAELRRRIKGGKLLQHYAKHLEKAKTGLKAASIGRRHFVAKDYFTYVEGIGDVEVANLDEIDAKQRRVFINDSNQQIQYFSSQISSGARRRHPSTLSVLPPSELLRFFDAFLDPMLRSSAKLMYATGLRREEVSNLSAGSIAGLKSLYPGGPAELTVIGKGNKERTIEIESALLPALKALLTSKQRMKRALLYAQRYKSNPYADNAPFLLNRFGDRLSTKAIAEGFVRASTRCRIKRTPHELRHEFAVAFLLISYKALAKKLEVNGLDTWLARLMIQKNDIVVLRLAHLLGHADPATTRKTYLTMLAAADPSIRDAWCKHLEGTQMEDLA